MDDGGVMTLAKPVFPRPKLVVQPRNSSEGFIQGGLNSATPTPMSFVSLYGDSDPYTDCKPFSSLLAGALGSPTFPPMAFFNNPVNKRTVADMRTSDGDEKPAQTELNEMGKVHEYSQSISSARYKAMMPSQLPITSSSPHLTISPVNKRTVADMQTSDGDEKPAQTETNEMEKVHEYSQSISSARYKAMMPSRLPITSSSPHLTISPGISPATLLESPIFFSMNQTDPSPTTGTFSILPSTHGVNNASMGEDRAKSPEINDNFIFKPHPLEEKYRSPANMGLVTFGTLAEETAKPSDGQWQCHMGSKDLHGNDVLATDSTLQQAPSFSSGVLEPQDHLESMSMASAVVPVVTKLSNGRLPTDGYNWKKYGQKTLKNSENPRSYYKCTHPNCPAKKQVECSQEGEITEIMYKGKHNHAKPQGTRKRAKNGSLVVGAYHDHIVQDSIAVSKMNHDKASGDLSASYVRSHGGIPGTTEFSFTSPSNEDDENGEASIAGDDGEDEHHSKHRRIENEKEDFSRGSVRATREPRVVVQTVSEKDILDDGYRWRKYGQKVVKGHAYPRNYYKCTNIGCKVRKHVERSSVDSTCVMTTYEGKHNHSVPPARGSTRETEEDAIASVASYPTSPVYMYSEGTYYAGMEVSDVVP